MDEQFCFYINLDEFALKYSSLICPEGKEKSYLASLILYYNMYLILNVFIIII